MAQSAPRTEPGGDLEALLQQGDDAWARNDRAAAHEAYRAAQRLDGNDPRVLSRLGLTLTVVARDEYKGIAFCEEALRRGANDADSLYRLALVYEATFQKERAVRAVREGLAIDRSHPGLRAMIERLGVRRPPVIPFLARSNPINKYLGMLRHRILRARERE
jgi:cytochrome c-type biogenesis protein CcmH/NrfG